MPYLTCLSRILSSKLTTGFPSGIDFFPDLLSGRKILLEAKSTKTLVEKEQHQANRDALTTLPNRASCTQRLEHELERYQRYGYNLALRMLRDPSAAEDVTQDAFFSAYRNIGRYRGGSLRSWLLTIVANGARDVLLIDLGLDAQGIETEARRMLGDAVVATAESA